MTNLTAMTAADLSAYFAQLTGKTVKPGSYSKAAWIAKVEAAETAILAQEVEAKKALPIEELGQYGLGDCDLSAACPHCGINHHDNGFTTNTDQFENGLPLLDREYGCLGCNGTWGPLVNVTDIRFEGPTFTLVQVAAALTMSPKAARAKYRRYENDGVSTRYVFDNNAAEVARVVAVLKGKRG